MSFLQLHRIRNLILVLLSVSYLYSNAYAQQKVFFDKDNSTLLTSSKTEKFTSAKYFSLNTKSLQDLPRQKEVIFEFEDQQTFQIQLETIEAIPSNHIIHVGSQHSTQKIQTELTTPIYILSGKVNSNTNSKVSFIQTETGIEGFIDTGTETYYIEKLQSETISKSSSYIFYQSKDVTDKAIHCLVNEQRSLNQFRSNTKSNTKDCISIDLAIAVNYNYFQIYDYNITDVIARTFTVMNASAHDYATAFNDSISFNITEHFISTCDDCDPWGSNRDALYLLDEFSHWAEEGGFSEDFDLGQLWTGGDLQLDQNSNTIGYAFKGGLCSNKRYHVLEDYSESLWKLRLLATHEIGHNLDCTHDQAGSNTIMAPTISNTDTWSAASIADLNSFVNSISCVGSCDQIHCQLLTDFSVDEYSDSALHLSWSQGDSTRIILHKEHNNETIYDFKTEQLSTVIDYSFSNCDEYSLRVNSICNGVESSIISISLGNPAELFTNIVQVEPSDCKPGNPSEYDLEFLIEHNASHGEPFYIDILGETTTFYYSNSPQLVKLDAAQIKTEEDEFLIQLFTILNSKLYCLDEIEFVERPNEHCDLLIKETFDDCQLPFGWQTSSTNQNYFPFPYSWQFNDDSRKVLNYAKGDNISKDKTIDGSCMAYFDDDINSGDLYTGNIVMYSDEYDLSEFTNLELTFSYIFHDFSDIKSANNSYFSVELWDGSSWKTVLVDNEIGCPWSDVWNSQCINIFTVDLDQFANDSFQCRFIYSDGDEGDWTGMIALDNFILNGDKILTEGCTEPGSINFNPLANLDDGSCYSCSNGLQDGQETAIDCGGSDCDECVYPCDEEDIHLEEIKTSMTIINVDNIYSSAVIDGHSVILNPAVSANFEAGFEVKNGAVLEVYITKCTE